MYDMSIWDKLSDPALQIMANIISVGWPFVANALEAGIGVIAGNTV